MNWFQKFMNKYFGWKYAVFYSRSGSLSIQRYHELPNGTLYLKEVIFNKVMNKDGSMSMSAIFNCDSVKWEKL